MRMPGFKILSVLFLTCLVMNAGAQQYDCNCTEPDNTSGSKADNLLVFREYQNPVHNYRGTQFFNAWSQGYVILNNGEKVNNMMLRYDMFTDELLWLRPNDFVTGIVKKTVIKGFVITGDEAGESYFIKRSIRPPGMDTIRSFLQVLAEGDLDFLVYRNVVKAVSESKTVDNTIYYIFTDDRSFTSIRLKRRSLVKFPGIDRERMKNIIKSGKLNVKNELNFTQAVYLYNQAGG